MPLTRERAEVELWWRNPQFYIQQCVEVGTFNFVWDRRYLYKRRLDHLAHVTMYARANPWRSLVIDEHYAVLYDAEHMGEHVACWPTWSAEKDSWRKLIKLIMNPWSDEASDDEFAFPARAGQKHVIIIKDLPNPKLIAHKAFYEDLQLIQADYSQVTFFLHGSYSFKVLCGMGFKIGDFEPRTAAAGGNIYTHGGRFVKWSDVPDYWVRLFGMNVNELRVPANRCLLNIESCLWNAAYWNSTKRFAVGHKGRGEDELEAHLKENHLIFTKRLARRPGDRISCDDCSLWLHCKYFREGSVCAVPNTDMSEIAKLFGTRQSDQIIKGLGKLLQVNVERAESGMKAETDGDEKRAPGQIDPALNKLMNDIQTSAVKLLELVDPQYRKQSGKVQVAINTGGAPAQTAITTGDPEAAARELASRAYTALLDQGFTPDQLAAEPELIRGMMQTMLQPAIEG